MFDSFSVKLRRPFRDADTAQKSQHCVVPLTALISHFASSFGEKDGPVGLGVHVAVPLEPCNGAVDGHMGYAQPPRQIHHPSLTHAGGEICNGLDIVFRRFSRPLAPRVPEIFRLSRF